MAKTILITGSNRGIGLALCRHLQQRGETVIATCRKASSALTASGVEIIEGVDVSVPETLSQLSQQLGDRQLDWLINNAGIAGGLGLNDINVETLDTFRKMYDVNSLGPLVTTHILQKHLSVGSKVGIITSRMGSIADNDSGGSYAYRMSKSAVNAAGKSLSIDLKPKGIAVAILHPGYVKTDMTGHQGLIEVDESATGLIGLMDALSLETSGGFWHTNGEPLPW
ncbi:MAG TPA: short-chain dehydrogenase [Gammaproteobacteria bacterium]|nr:short-chain dehydrogenase [Gammaproteobacteria bacterium]